MHDVWEQMGPLLMLRWSSKRGKRRQEDRWREGNRRCNEIYLRDTAENLKGKDETKRIKNIFCVWLTLKKKLNIGLVGKMDGGI